MAQQDARPWFDPPPNGEVDLKADDGVRTLDPRVLEGRYLLSAIWRTRSPLNPADVQVLQRLVIVPRWTLGTGVLRQLVQPPRDTRRAKVAAVHVRVGELDQPEHVFAVERQLAVARTQRLCGREAVGVALLVAVGHRASAPRSRGCRRPFRTGRLRPGEQPAGLADRRAAGRLDAGSFACELHVEAGG
jgi:hypothetical protein